MFTLHFFLLIFTLYLFLFNNLGCLKFIINCFIILIHAIFNSSFIIKTMFKLLDFVYKDHDLE